MQPASCRAGSRWPNHSLRPRRRPPSRNKRLSRPAPASAVPGREVDAALAGDPLEPGGELGVEGEVRPTSRVASPPSARSARSGASVPLPPRAAAKFRHEIGATDASVGEPHRHLQPGPLGQASSGWKRLTVTRGASSPGRRSSSTVSSPQLPALAAASSAAHGSSSNTVASNWPVAIGKGRHHVAPALGRRPPARFLDQAGHHRRRPAAIGRRRKRGQLGEGCGPCARRAGGAARRPGGPRNRSRRRRARRPCARPGSSARRAAGGSARSRASLPPPNRPCCPLVRWSAALAAWARIVSAAA